MRRWQWTKVVDTTMAVLGVSWVVYQLVFTRYLLQGPIEHLNTHLCFALILVFLAVVKRRPRAWPLMLPLMLLALISTGYIKVFYEEIELRVGGLPTTPDTIFSFCLIFVVLVATWLSVGRPLAYVVLLFLAYAFWGHHLPPPLYHYPIPLFCMPGNYVTTFTGLYGRLLAVSANTIFLFFILGGLLQATGVSRVFIEIGKLAGRTLAGGPAMMAVVSSALVGTITGGAPSNVAITGPVTIPLMKKVGYTAAQAGAIEAVASSGAMLVPPVMGAVVFVMSDVTGVPYIMLCAMALIPAALYYLSIGLYVQLNALKRKIPRSTETFDTRVLLMYGPNFVIPLVVLTMFLVQRFSPAFSAFLAIMAFVAVCLIRKETRGSFQTWVRGCVTGANMAAQIGVTLAIVGLITATLNMTGTASRLPAMVEEAAGGNLLIGLILIGLITILFGCAVPIAATYIMVAILAVPALLHMGVAVMAAHWFILFFTLFAYFTPPVGIAPLVAAPLAGATYLKTAVECLKAVAIAMLLPFIVVWAPAIILQPQQELLFTLAAILASFSLVLLLQISLVGYYLTELNWIERAAGVVSGGLVLCFLPTQSYLLLAVGLVIGFLLTLWQLRRKLLSSKTKEGIKNV